MAFKAVNPTVYGPMGPHFQEALLRDICDPSCGVQTGPFGSQLHKEDYVENGTPIVTVEHLGENHFLYQNLPGVSDKDKARLSKYTLQTGDIVFSRVGSVDRRALVRTDEEGWLFSGRCLRVRPNSKVVNPAWLSYFFGHPQFQEYLRSIAVGATMPSINTGILSSVPVYFPGLEEQAEIASVLCALDDRIENLRATNETLEAIAQTLFKSWFVDFDPVKAKAEGKIPVGMDAETAALFPSEFEESEMGPIPKGWSASTLAKAYDLNPARKLHRTTAAPYLDMASVSETGGIKGEPVSRMPGSGAKFRNGDTLLARITPCLENGKSTFVDFLDDDQVGWGSTEFLVLWPKEPLPLYHAYMLSRCPDFRSYAIQSMSGTSGRQRIQNDVLGRYLIAVPSNEVAVKFGEITSSAQALISANSREARSLSKLRDVLLPKLISGELRLPGFEDSES